jgi:hypothetical protein
MVPHDTVEGNIRVIELTEDFNTVSNDWERGCSPMEEVACVDNGINVVRYRLLDSGFKSACEIFTSGITAVLAIPEMGIAQMEDLGHFRAPITVPDVTPLVNKDDQARVKVIAAVLIQA